ncbi:hypothetical protein AgCh_032054 [Apium graveolens]
MSLQNNFITNKRALAKTINQVRAVVVNVDDYLQKRIVVNINNGGVDRCLQVSLSNLRTLRAFELDVVIDKVHRVITEDTRLFNELKNAQIAAFPEAYLYPSKHHAIDGLSGNSLKSPASTTYAYVFAPHHNWAIRKAVVAGMYALPTKAQLLTKLNEDAPEVVEKLGN